MLTRFGIGTAELTQIAGGQVFTASMRACQSCPNGATCAAWLCQAPDRIDRVPEFCPNARRFEQTKALLSASGTPH